MRLWLVAIMVNHQSHRRRVIFGHPQLDWLPGWVGFDFLRDPAIGEGMGVTKKTRGQELYPLVN